MFKVISYTPNKLRKISFEKLHQRNRKYSVWSYWHNSGLEPLRAITTGQLLEETVRKYGDRDALVACRSQDNKRITFRNVLNQADKLASGLKTLDLNKGDRIGLWAPNVYEWYMANMAAARLGLIVVGINPAYQAPELEYSINKVGIKAIVMDDTFKTQDYYEILSKLAPDLERSEPGKLKSTRIPSLEIVISMSQNAKKGAFSYGELSESTENVEKIRKCQSDIGPDDPYNIQFSSGTTGHPKAVSSSHFHQVNNGYYAGKRNELDRKHHKICVQVPMFHAFGTTLGILGSLCHGATIVLPAEGFDPDKSLDAIKNEKCTVIFGTPTMYVDLVHIQEKRNEEISPEIALTGGALCAPQLIKKMLRVLKVKKVKSIYGLTETTAVTFQSDFNDDEEKSTTTVGKVMEHLEVKVVDTDGRMVPFGTPGELCTRGYSNMLGFWGDDGRTKETVGWDRWLKTGDQFILTQDGYGKVVGRLKEMILRGGENIYPKEIEELLNTHPAILESHVVGLPHERLGEEVCACVRLYPNKNLTKEEIKEFCIGQIAHFKIPTQLRIIQNIPKTVSGKIQKFKLVEMAIKN